MLVPNLNRDMTAGTDRRDDNAHLDDTGRSHGTNHGLMRIIGRDRVNSQAQLETQEGTAHGNPTETPRKNDKLTLEQPAQGINEKIHKDSKRTELKLNPNKNKRHHCVLTPKELMKIMLKEFFQRKEEDQIWEKKKKPDSA